MKLSDLFAYFGNAFTYILVVVQTDEILKIISFALSIAVSLTILASKIIAWWKRAKEDGKIDSKEMEELSNILKDGKESIDKKGEENGKSK